MSAEFELTVGQAHEDVVEARRIRREVFIEEQGIPAHLDPDGFDDAAFHVLCRIGPDVVGTGRLVSIDGARGVLARIAVLSAYRGRGLGQEIVMKLESVAVEQGLRLLSLQPHAHLEGFYASLGYHTVPGTDVVGEHALITMEKAIGAAPSTDAG